MQIYARSGQFVQKNGIALRLKMALFGHAKLGDVDDLEFYAFKCRVHGITSSYAQGHDRYLECPYCRHG